jgi:membrane-associated phospholipid phosphatase
MDALSEFHRHSRQIRRYTAMGLVASSLTFITILETDRAIAEFIKRNAGPAWVSSAQVLSTLSACALFILGLVLVNQHLTSSQRQITWERLIVLFLTAVGAVLCAEVLKGALGRIGPEEYLASGAYGFRHFEFIGNMDRSSFPSEYGALTGVAAATLWVVTPTYRPTVVFLAMLLPASQLAIGTHFLSDIIAGIAIGIFVFVIVSKLARRQATNPKI